MTTNLIQAVIAKVKQVLPRAVLFRIAAGRHTLRGDPDAALTSGWTHGYPSANGTAIDKTASNKLTFSRMVFSKRATWRRQQHRPPWEQVATGWLGTSA